MPVVNTGTCRSRGEGETRIIPIVGLDHLVPREPTTLSTLLLLLLVRQRLGGEALLPPGLEVLAQGDVGGRLKVLLGHVVLGEGGQILQSIRVKESERRVRRLVISLVGSVGLARQVLSTQKVDVNN